MMTTTEQKENGEFPLDEVSRSLKQLRAELDVAEKYMAFKLGTIYALYEFGDSTTIHYVGATLLSITERLRLHKSCATHGGTTPVCLWIREVIDRGSSVLVKPLLENISEREIWNREIEMIRAMSGLFPLKNVTYS